MVTRLITVCEDYKAKIIEVEHTELENKIRELLCDEFRVFVAGQGSDVSNTICFCDNSRYKPKEDEKGLLCIDRLLFGTVVIAGFRHNRICGLTDSEIKNIYTNILPN